MLQRRSPALDVIFVAPPSCAPTFNRERNLHRQQREPPTLNTRRPIGVCLVHRLLCFSTSRSLLSHALSSLSLSPSLSRLSPFIVRSGPLGVRFVALSRFLSRRQHGEVYFRRVAAEYGQKTQYQEYVCDCPCRSWKINLDGFTCCCCWYHCPRSFW